MIDLPNLARRWGLRLDARGTLLVPGGYVCLFEPGGLALVLCGDTRPSFRSLPQAASVLYGSRGGATVTFPLQSFGAVLSWIEQDEHRS